MGRNCYGQKLSWAEIDMGRFRYGPKWPGTNTSSVGEMLDELEWPSLEARRDQSSLLLFSVSIEKDKYLTPCLGPK